MSHLQSLPVAVPPLDDDNLLEEILVRLPPQPSFLLRASLACKRWCRVLSDHRFLRRFCKQHRKPPLLGFFENKPGLLPVLTPSLDPPDRIPAARFTLPQKGISYEFQRYYFMSCRHGLAVLVHPPRREIIVWDPLTSQQQCVSFPPGIHDQEYTFWFWHAMAMCADTEDGHVHGNCFSSPFKLVFIWVIQQKKAFACLYESESGVWGDIVSMAFKDVLHQTGSSVLVGNAIYWLLHKGDLVAFDFERHNFALIQKPLDAYITDYRSAQLLRTKDGGLGLAVLLGLTIKFWERKSNCDKVDRWLLLQKTIQLELLPCTMLTDCKTVLIVGYDEESNVIVLSTIIGNFMLQLDSMQIRHIVKRYYICDNTFFPYTNFYIAVKQTKGEEDLGPKKSELSCISLQ